jgi:hypothetical protein
LIPDKEISLLFAPETRALLSHRRAAIAEQTEQAIFTLPDTNSSDVPVLGPSPLPLSVAMMMRPSWPIVKYQKIYAIE